MIFPALLLLVPLAPMQSVGRVVVTEGNDPAVHLRPAAWQLLQQDILAVVGSDIEIAYSVTFTNHNSAPVTFSSIIGFGATFVNGGHYAGGLPCWGIEYFQDDYWHVVDLPAAVTLDPGQSQTLTGRGSAASVQWQGAPYSQSLCVEDGLHGTLNMRIWPPVGRPVPAWRAGAGPFGTIYGTDLGSVVVQHDMRIRTEYSLPLTGTQGCVPATPNSTGSVGELAAFGIAFAAPGGSLLTLSASSLPPSAVALPLVGRIGQPATPLGLGQGVLCISDVTRWGAGLGTVTLAGSILIPVDAETLSSATGALAPGTTLHFQLWHRDVVQGQATSNTTGSTLVQFQ